MTTIAVMQPYFFPYAGYYRLLAAADLFVVFDCVQFPRRGWVHRNRLAQEDGSLDWLTLPLQKASYDAPISALAFAESADATFRDRCRRFPALRDQIEAAERAPLIDGLLDLHGSPVDYLERTLRNSAEALGYAPEIRRSSALAIDPALRGPDRVLAIAAAVGAARYVNPSGGLGYYDPTAFDRQGIELAILEPHEGPMASLLGRLLSEPADQIAAEIDANLRFHDAAAMRAAAEAEA